MAVPAILFPADPLAPRRPDPHFTWEARLLRELGGDHALVDHDALLAGDAEAAVRRVPAGIGPLWYRGWMIPGAGYARFAAALDARGGTLLTSPAGYTSAHELPGWYRVFEGATPASVWIPVPSPGRAPRAGELAAAAARLGGTGAAIVKDYVKSRKHEWAEACYVPELADLAALERVVNRFVELQDDFLAGGVVLRRFEDFARTADGRAAEARVWWLDGEPVLVGPHPDSPRHAPDPDLTDVRPLVRALGCRFVTTDLAQRADGSAWRVVEVGDGQVSDLPSGVDAAALLSSLIAA
ncbi:ATP-grasp domain-containing protein [Kitasatospora sp. NBC_00240]|uniref:ATP-grasp domain-containing protein n=1 Tax=Kitasatospora sp. NBC_00240 TaxID=2903567 RepID=UPI0022593114|nr:ATP-grasp domain-containing protein [Kitasatospora sp. NBC_00240]MCX5212806.1 ATP-grasp domain-containing protein [Kitasatospora sp. NBC_00240]